MKMQKYTKFSLIFIGIVIGALVFSQFNPATRPVINSSPQQMSEQPAIVDAASRPIQSLQDFNRAFVEIAEKVNPTVVTVFTEKVLKVRSGYSSPFFFNSPFSDFFEDFFGSPYQRPQQPREQEYRQQGLGSGVIVNADGYIITNNHVIADADTIQVRLINEKTYPAKVIGTDPKTDIAILKVDAKDLPALKMGDSDQLKVGEWVLAIGSPMSPNLAHTVTRGIVSAKGRSNVGLADYEDFIQTDAAINPGNSGGALINLNGELVGINTAIISKSGGFQGIGFAVPVNMARHVMESLIKHGAVIRGWLGVNIQNINETMAQAMDLEVSEGALVADVTKDSPAEKAGLEAGDVIIKYNGKKVTNVTQLRNEVAATAPDTKVDIKFIRDGKTKTVTVKIGKLKADEIAPETDEKLEKLFGFTVAPFNKELASKYKLDKSLEGVVIVSIISNSPAYRAGLREGDLLTAMNRKKIADMEEFNNLVQDLKKGDTIFFRVVRKNMSSYVAFKL